MARRINTRFLTGLLAVVIGGPLLAFVIGVVIVPRFMNKQQRGNAAPRIAEGDRLMNAGDFEKARDQYRIATDADPGSTDALVKLGDALARMAADDPTALQAAHQSWSRAITIDPKCKPALNRLLESYWEFLQNGGVVRDDQKAELYAKVIDLADKVLVIEQGDKRAAARRQLAVLQKWLKTNTVPTQDIKTAIDKTQELIKSDPTNAELPTWLAQAKIRQAQDMINGGQRASALVALEEAANIFDASRTAQPDNGLLHFRAFQTYNQLQKADPRTRDAARTATVEERYNYRKRAGEALVTALAKTSDKEELYADIQIAAADWYSQQDKPDEARKVIEKFYTSHPNDQRARLAWARVLSRGKDAGDRAKAVAVLSQELPPDPGLRGFRALLRRELEAQTLHELAVLYLADYAQANEAKETAKTKKLEQQVLESIDKLRRLSSPKHFRVLGLEGRLYLLKGQNVEAVKTLTEAVANMGAVQDFDLMYALARAQVLARQPGPAKQQLERVVGGNEGWVQPRIMLTDLLLQESDVEGAKRHLAVLEQRDPANAEVKRLRNLATMMDRKDANSSAIFEKMAEGTREERKSKAKIALQLDKPDEAVRLLKSVFREDAKDQEAIQVLIGVYESRSQRDRAREVVADALKADPENAKWKIASLRYSEATPQQIYDQAKPLILKNTDEFQRSIQMYDLERSINNTEEALKYLKRAYDLKPDDKNIADTLYGNAVARRDWTEAEKYLKKLVELNADEVGGLLYRQRYAMARGNLSEAETLGIQLIDQYKEFAMSWLCLAQAQQSLGKFEEAARTFVEVRKRQPNQYEALRGLVECYYQINRPEDALAHLREGRARFPRDTTLRELYLNHLVNYGNPAEAIPEREKLLQDNPDEPGLYLSLAATYFHTAQQTANSGAPGAGKKTADLLNDAFGKLDAGLQRFPDDVRFYAQKAELFQYAGKLESAAEVFRALAQRPTMQDKPLPFIMQSEHELRIGRPDLAEKSLAGALQKSDPNEATEVRLRLAAVLSQQRKFREATAVLLGVGNPDDPRVVRQQIEILIAAGELQRAEAEVRKAVAARDAADLRTLLASILIDTGHVDVAMKELDAATKMDPRSEVARYLHALALAKQATPDVNGSIQELIELRNRNPRNIQVRLLLSELYSNTARTDPAIRELEEGLARVPLNKEARLKLIALYRGKKPPAYEEAISTCLAAQRDPVLRTDPAWLREEAIIYMQQKRIPEAIVRMDDVVKLAPGNIEFARERLDMILQFNDYEAVIRESDKLLARNTDEWWLRHQRGLAFAKRRNADIAKSLSEFDRAIELAEARGNAPTVEFILRGMSGAIVQFDANNKPVPVGYDEALKRLTPRLQKDPEGRWHLLLAALHRGKGGKAGFEAAAVAINQMLADPSNKEPRRRAPILRAAADIYQNAPTPDIEAARKAYIELIAIEPTDLAALNNVAVIYAESLTPAQPQQAKIYSTKAYETTRLSGSPNDLIYDTHARVLTLCGEDDMAVGIKILKDVTARRPDLLDARYHLGDAYLRQRNPQYPLALEQLQVAADLIGKQEKDGATIDANLRDKVLKALAKARDGIKK